MSGPKKRTRRAGDRGQVAVEYLGFLPILLLLALVGVQMGLAAYAAQQAGTAARVAARTATHDGTDMSPKRAGEEAVSDWLDVDVRVARPWGGDEVEARATVRIPSVIPGFSPGDVARTATLPAD
ncbi:TadE/TadG family type IV pilus assembly protein [Streptomyces purpureus]|uniref:Septum formation initiator n=1 Tax=Streptomyces purpureus TaxID=1951 RepID=A0A918HDB9_9ACTN|nr:TadE/TadG family type IV pilus assembly protein [Streptomyces purpureus]GGT52640.1 septum formation initiator [Streptomyces purpureus]